jgi:hypothetical protein
MKILEIGNKSLLDPANLPYQILTSLLVRESIWEKFANLVSCSELSNAIWADSSYFLYLLLLSVCKILTSFQPTL